MTEAQAIATEIRNQITAQSPMALFSYAAKNFVAHGETETRRAALEFRVSGYAHKGLVRINLAWNDTYTIETVKIRKGQVKICKSYDNVYFDQMIEVLDHMIEGRQYDR